MYIIGCNKNIMHRIFVLRGILALCTATIYGQIVPSTRVNVTELVKSSHAEYTYTVANNARAPIVAIRIGYDQARDTAELDVAPSGWTLNGGIPSSSIQSPSNWKPEVIAVEESRFKWLEWRNGQGLLPGDILGGFTVVVPVPNGRYRTSHFDVILNDGTHVSGLIEGSSMRIRGDVNGDGKVDCADVSAIRNIFGTRAGEGSFDPFADVNGDGAIDIRDLAFVSQKLAAGTKCP